jgi:hypothetical protein
MIATRDSRGSPPAKTCQAHCRACGRHFHGDRAFDKHRVFVDGDGMPLDPQPRSSVDWSRRGCAHPEDVGLHPAEGVCRISFDATAGPCTVWQERAPGSFAQRRAGAPAVSALAPLEA